MGDPFSITLSCVGLLGNIAQLAVQINNFVANVRDAQKDLTSVTRELRSLELSVRAIQDSCGMKTDLPANLKQNLGAILNNCNNVSKQMQDLLLDYSTNRLGRKAQWSIQGRRDMSRLRSSLEAHKSAIEIALEMITIQISIDTRADVRELRANTDTIQSNISCMPQLQYNTEQILLMLREIHMLQFQLRRLQRAHMTNSVPLQRFLEDSESYAESICHFSDKDSFQNMSARSANLESEQEDFYSVSEGPKVPEKTDQTASEFQSNSCGTENADLPSSGRLDETTYAENDAHDPQSDPHFELLPVISNGQEDSQTVLSPSTSIASSWSYRSILIRVTNKFYGFKTARDATRDVANALAYLDPAFRAISLARYQKASLLTQAEKDYVDEQLRFTYKAMECAAILIEPARVDLGVNSKFSLRNRIAYVLKDSPKLQTCFANLGMASSGLNSAASTLYSKSEHGSGTALNTEILNRFPT